MGRKFLEALDSVLGRVQQVPTHQARQPSAEERSASHSAWSRFFETRAAADEDWAERLEREYMEQKLADERREQERQEKRQQLNKDAREQMARKEAEKAAQKVFEQDIRAKKKKEKTD